jgi:S1-C subfamily serine protease
MNIIERFQPLLVGLVAAAMLTGCVGPLVPVIAIDENAAGVVRSEVRTITMAELDTIEHERLGPVEATSCKNKTWDPQPTPSNATDQLRIRAQNLGANALAGLSCGAKQGTSMVTNCWSSITCYALAVRTLPPGQKGAVREPVSAQKITARGSAFVVSNAGHVVTNAHVVEGCTAVELTGPKGSASASVVARDATTDLALLLSTPPIGAALPFRREPRIRSGEPVVAMGFPLSGLLASEAQVGTGSISALAGLGGDTSRIQISAPVQPGSSGGPVFDSSANIVGVTVAKLNALKVAAATGDIPQIPLNP